MALKGGPVGLVGEAGKARKCGLVGLDERSLLVEHFESGPARAPSSRGNRQARMGGCDLFSNRCDPGSVRLEVRPCNGIAIHLGWPLTSNSELARTKGIRLSN